jgi:hypothetical protein
MSSPSPSGYFWVTWRVAAVAQEGPGPCTADFLPDCKEALQQAASYGLCQLPYLFFMHKKGLGSPSYL